MRTWIFWGLILAAGALVARADDFTTALDTLAQVRPGGADEQAAREAWQTVAKAPSDKLPNLLAAIDRASPLGANWLLTAADTIAQRSLDAKDTGLAKPLETFVLDRSHSFHARRLAYEWLGRFDTTAPQRLVPGFLDDPCGELRLDAVAQIIERADALLKASKQDEAKKSEALAEYRRAFAAARDPDQIGQVEKSLGELGEKVDLPRHYGFITHWHLIGPFDNTDKRGLDVAYPPEESLDFQASYPGKSGEIRWTDHATKDRLGEVDLNVVIGKAHDVIAYAAAEFQADRAQPVELRLGCGTACKVWLNGKYLTGQVAYHAGAKLDQFIGRGELKAGRNTILVKVCQNNQTEVWAQDWKFQLRVCDVAGTAVLPRESLAQGDANR